MVGYLVWIWLLALPIIFFTGLKASLPEFQVLEFKAMWKLSH